MRTALDAPDNALDEAEQSFVALIREHGWFRTSVFRNDGGPGFSYTTGFWVNAKQPELLIFTLKNETAHNVFWDAYRDAKDGQVLPIGQRTDALFGNFPAYVFPIAAKYYHDFLGWSRWFYQGDTFPCLQVVWPDRSGTFPWEPGFEAEFEADQLDLSEHGWSNEIAD